MAAHPLIRAGAIGNRTPTATAGQPGGSPHREADRMTFCCPAACCRCRTIINPVDPVNQLEAMGYPITLLRYDLIVIVASPWLTRVGIRASARAAVVRALDRAASPGGDCPGCDGTICNQGDLTNWAKVKTHKDVG